MSRKRFFPRPRAFPFGSIWGSTWLEDPGATNIDPEKLHWVFIKSRKRLRKRSNMPWRGLPWRKFEIHCNPKVEAFYMISQWNYQEASQHQSCFPSGYGKGRRYFFALCVGGKWGLNSATCWSFPCHVSQVIFLLSAGRSTGKSLSFETEKRDPKRQRLWESQIAKRLGCKILEGSWSMGLMF